MLQTPVLFIIFNRFDTASKVFESIRQARPQKLYIAGDGPRPDRAGEEKACQQVRRLAELVDWPCEVKTMFLEENLGPSIGPYSFIKWFFAQEEQGIVLEHDCLPHPDFFPYCETLLNKYKDDPHIGVISGSNFLSKSDSLYSYTFSMQSALWGWASWRRTIDSYTLNLSYISKSALHTLLKPIPTFKERIYLRTIFAQIKRKEIQTWDYHLSFCLMFNNLFAISPSRNLISNIGFGYGALHTTDTDSPLANLPTEAIMPLVYCPDNAYPRNIDDENTHFHLCAIGHQSTWWFYIKIILKQLGVFPLLMRLKHRLRQTTSR